METTKLEAVGVAILFTIVGMAIASLIPTQETTPEPVTVEKVVYQTSDQPCSLWELSTGKTLGHPGGGDHLTGQAVPGWKPYGVSTHHGVAYRRCTYVTPDEPEEVAVR